MYNVPDIWLVDTHAKSDCANNYSKFVGTKGVLYLALFVSFNFCMVEVGLHTGLLQQ